MAPSPLDAAARLAGFRGRMLLHSARDGDGPGGWSFVTAEPRATLIGNGTSLVRLDAAGRPVRRFTADPLDAAQAFLAEHGCRLEPAAAGPPAPRVIGYLGYELARVLLPHPLAGRARPRAAADLWLAAYDAVARWPGGEAGEPEVIGEAAARARLEAHLARPARPSLPPSLGPLVPDDDGDHHAARIERVRDFLAAGEAALVGLARRRVARIAAPGDALHVYAALAAAAPAPYGALLECDGATVISGSPGRFLAMTGDHVELRPLAGAPPRAAGDAAARRLLVELGREDLGRIADPDSLVADDPALGPAPGLGPGPAPARRASGDARLAARPRPGVGYADLLRATFPGGAVTGAPKLRAIEIIDELEPAPRGPHGGAIGYFGPGGEMELSIGSRIGVIVGPELRVHVGGSVTAAAEAADAAEQAGAEAEAEAEAAAWVAALDAIARAAARPPAPRG